MSYIFLLISSICAAIALYIFCSYTKIVQQKTCLTAAILAAFAVGATLFFVAPPTKYSSTTDTIIVGTSADFPPFSFMQDGTIVGLDIDIIQEVAQRLHKHIELRNMPFNTLLPSLQLGTLQVLAAGLTATPERAKHVLFAKPHLENNKLIIISRKSTPVHSLDALQGKEVVVNEGYTADLYLSALKGINIMRLKTSAEAFLALSSGRAFAFITAENTIKPFFDAHGSNDFYLTPITNTEENTALAVAPQYPELLAEIQRVLDTMKIDGSLAAIKTKWGV